MAALILSATILTSAGNAQTARKPLSRNEVIELLQNEVPPARVEELARKYGISFEVSPEAEKQLREAGATESVLNALRELAPRPSPPTPAPAVLSIEATPGGAQVYVDDEAVGTTSAEGRLKLSRLAPGEHRFRLSREGYQDFEQKVTLAAGEAVRIIAKLEAVKPAAPESGPAPSRSSEPSVEKETAVYERIAQAVSPAIVHIATTQAAQRALGSGVIVSPDGYIVTNNHIIANAAAVAVTLLDKRILDARVVGTDSQTDLALLKVAGSNFPTVPWGDSSALRLGATVLAFGNPLGSNFTMSRGSVTAIGTQDFIQTDAAINPGNSGGALVDLRGQVVGINTAIRTARRQPPSGEEPARIGFAVPASTVKYVLENLMRTGKVSRGYLGVSISDLNPALARQFKVPDVAGVLVNQVERRSPAEKAGLKQGDVIRTYDGLNMTDASRVRSLVAGSNPGTEVTLGIVRDGKPLTLKVTLGER